MNKKLVCGLLILIAVVYAQNSWTARKLIGTYTNWNYWWLNARIGIDQFDTVYCAVARYNYSQNDYTHDLYVLNSDGDTIRVDHSYAGYDYQPIVQDGAGTNIYIGQPVLGQGPATSPHMDAGVTDDSNCVSTTHSRSDTIRFTRLGPNGEHLIWLANIYAGNPWAGRTSLARSPGGRLHCTFADDTQYLVYGYSTDKGNTWTWDTLETISVMSHVRVIATPDTCVHIFFRTWTSGVQLYYMKLRPDGSVAVAPSIFTQASERWDPNIAVDLQNNLRVVYIDGASQAHNLSYTVLRSDLDASGQPVADSVLTMVPDTIIQYDAVRIAGPKICVDSNNRAHVIFEQGVYGTNQTKYVYHIRQEEGPGVKEFHIRSTPFLSIAPNPVLSVCRLNFSVDQSCDVHLALYDALGKHIKDILNDRINEGSHTIFFDRTGLSAGVYFLQYQAAAKKEVAKIVIVNR